MVVDDGTGIAELLLFEDLVLDLGVNFSIRVVDGSKVWILVFDLSFFFVLIVFLIASLVFLCNCVEDRQASEEPLFFGGIQG